MGSFPETYNDRTGYVASGGCTVHRLGKRSDRVIARKLERERAAMKRGMKREVERKRGNASPQTPRFYKTRHDISLFPLFFVRLFHAIFVTR